MSKETEARIRKLMTEHNKKVAAKGKGSKASMGGIEVRLSSWCWCFQP